MSNIDDLESAPIGRGKLRPLVEEMGARVRAVAAGQPTDIDALTVSWGKFIDAIALGEPPQVRDCPTCARTVMAGATKCDGCWSSLVPISPPSASSAVVAR